MDYILSILWESVWVFLIMSIFAFLSLNILKLRERVPNLKVFILIFVLTLTSLILGLITKGLLRPSFSSGIMLTLYNSAIFFIISYIFALYYWRFEQKSAIRFSILFIGITLLVFGALIVLNLLR